VCFDLMEAGKVDAVVSAGNSGAMLAGATLIAGRLPGVDRPAIGAVFPSLSGRTLMLDAGANAECKPLHLVQFALMGEVYARRMLGTEKPRIGVLSNGEEDTKGTELTRAAAAALRGIGDEFIGYAEGKDLFNGAVDVAVCDGFVSTLRQTMQEDVLASAGMLLARRALRRFREAMDWETVGGAPLVGCRGVSIVAHGRSGPKAIMNAIRVAAEAAAVGMDAELSAAAKAGRELLVAKKVAEG
jgi:glycerol-3-phosphate acyltransferase PlsX